MRGRCDRHFRSVLVFACLLGMARAEEMLPPTIQFNRDIRPILSDTCYKCHGPDKAKRKANLRFDFESSAKAKYDDHFVIVPGQPAQSELMRRIATDDPEKHMPPPDSALVLTPRQVELLNRWIEQGAKWQAHWSFIPPVRPEIPKVTYASWARNPVDNLI